MAEYLLASYHSSTADNTVYSVNWDAQSFPIVAPVFITKVLLKLYRYNLVGTIYALIRATTLGVPSGANLASKSMNGNDLTTSSSGAIYTFTFDTPLLVSAGQYAIVVAAPSGSGTKVLYWKRTTGSDGYPSGKSFFSSNSGASWREQSNADQWFEVWGEDAPVAIESSILPKLVAMRGVR
jgi:hypothetical protein